MGSATLSPVSEPLGLSLSRVWLESLLQAGFVPVGAVPEFSQRANGGGTGPIRLEFGRWLHPEGHEWRQTLITGPKVEILCCMGFPRDAGSAPVFAAETIGYHGSLKIAVVDLEPAMAVQEAFAQLPWWERLMEEMATAYGPAERQLLQSDQPHPEWATGCFSPGVVYCRPEAESDLPALEDGLRRVGSAYHQIWLDGLWNQSTLGDQASAPLSWDSYRSHHAAHTPGRPFLRAQFGAEWTEEFLSRHMYGN